jgi:hypothetical protein
MYLREEPVRAGRPLAPATVQRKLSACASFYRYAEFVGDLVEKVRIFMLPRG